jgi:hypothetical protein
VDDDACVIVLGNNYSGAASFMINDIAAIAFGEKYEVMSVMKTAKVDAKVLDSYVGRYQGDANFFRPNAVLTIEKQEDQLALNYWGSGPAPLTPLSSEKFYERTFGASVNFVRDAKGDVTHFVYQGAAGSYELKRIR